VDGGRADHERGRRPKRWAPHVIGMGKASEPRECGSAPALLQNAVAVAVPAGAATVPLLSAKCSYLLETI
jgi:hypothetical protein